MRLCGTVAFACSIICRTEFEMRRCGMRRSALLSRLFFCACWEVALSFVALAADAVGQRVHRGAGFQRGRSIRAKLRRVPRHQHGRLGRCAGAGRGNLHAEVAAQDGQRAFRRDPADHAGQQSGIVERSGGAECHGIYSAAQRRCRGSASAERRRHHADQRDCYRSRAGQRTGSGREPQACWNLWSRVGGRAGRRRS